MLAYSPRSRTLLARPVLWIHGKHSKRVNTFMYLVPLINGRITWHPAVRLTLLQYRRLLEVLHQKCEPSWGNSPSCMLGLYNTLIVSRLFYAPPLLHISHSQ